MSAKTVLAISFIIMLLSFGLAFLVFKLVYEEPTSSITEVTAAEVEEIIQPEKEKIDSLTIEIQGREEIISHLKDSIVKLKATWAFKVDSIRKLPLTEEVDFLKNKLREFESKYQEE